MNKNTKQNSSNSFGIIEKIENFSRNRFVVALLLLIVSVVFFVNYAAMYDKKLDMNGDNIYYFALGKAIHDGHGYTNTMSLSESPHTHFPPGYSAFISVLFNISPNDVQFVKKANGVLLYLSIVMLFWIAMITTKNSILAFCTSLLASLHNELLRWATIMMSETLLIFLSLAAILLTIIVVNWSFKPKRKWLLVLLIVLLTAITAYIYFVRTMGLAVILALIGWSGIMMIISFVKWRKSIKTDDTETTILFRNQFILRLVVAAALVFGTATAVLSWEARNQSIGFTGSDYKKDFLKKANGEQMSTKEDWIARFKSNSTNFIARWVPEATWFHEYDKDQPVTAKEWAKGIMLAALLIIGACYLSTGGFAFICYVFLTVGVLIFYYEQYGGTRYLTPIMPILIFLLLSGICGIFHFLYKITKRKSSPWVLQTIALLIITFGVLTPIYAKKQEENRKLAGIKAWTSVGDVRMTNYIEACKWCGENLPDTARMMCRKPEIYYMYSDFHKSAGMPWAGEPDTILQMFRDNNLEYVIIDSWFRHGYATIYPCIQKYYDKFKLIKQFGEVDQARQLNPTLIFQFNDEWGYTGDMVDGHRQGQGTLNMNDGRKYVGAFAADSPNGYGVLYAPDGKIISKGIWQNGILVKPQ